MSDVGRITEFLKEHPGEKRYLADWCSDINKFTRKKLTKREMAHIFNRVLPQDFSVERVSNPIRYAFVPLYS